MTKRYLFDALCGLADALQAECVRLDFSPHKLQLEAITERLDVVIDEVLEAQSLDDEVDVLPRLKSRDSQDRSLTPEAD